ncbi:molybdopterin cofactor-binding domain-containing protein [Marinomonas sp. PE14-40]|uniref:xanthine dehydrogenase family protein molybdopterin-binding subunit n=1 Tax=Marinomonas sp. PE14-40 TaxID=3060621 RepID=UPI003F67C405
MSQTISRRGFLKSAATGSAVMMVGLNAGGLLAVGTGDVVVNPFVSINQDGEITVVIKHFEMGQGTTTGLTTLVAEELDADWQKMKIDFAPADGIRYKNLFFGAQLTGGSTAIANSYMQYREAGAMARDLLVRSASAAWNVSPNQIQIRNGVISVGSKTAHFGEFVKEAMTLKPNDKPVTKTPDQFNLIGKLKLPRKDSQAKTTGQAMFAMDVKLPGMLYVAIHRSPKFGGKVSSFNLDGAKKIGGFVDAKPLANKAGIAVYAKNTWAAFKARDALKVSWDFSGAETRGTEEMRAEYKRLVDEPAMFNGLPTTKEAANTAMQDAEHLVEADFQFPFLSHAPMEPLNCVIEKTANGVRFHDGCQGPSLVQGVVAYVLGLEQSQVEVKTFYAGGSFGRRANANSDYHVEAALAFQAYGGQTPVKLVWSREDDIRGGYYRPMSMHRAKIGLDAKGQLLGWDHHVAAQPIMKGTPFEAMVVHNGIDHTSVEGLSDTLYQVPNMSMGVSDFKSVIPVLWWRSVGHSHTAFVMESLMDMAAAKAKRDPVALRLSLLNQADAKGQRMANTIKTARDMANWKEGDKRGFASHFSFNTYVAVVADVSVKAKQVHIDKLYIAVDCGVAINPDVIKAQMEGGAGFALGAIARNEVTLDKGEVIEANFPQYEPTRFGDMPEIEVEIVRSNEAPTGVGEPAVPPTGPAIANAIYAVTGMRITDLPMTKAGFTFS